MFSCEGKGKQQTSLAASSSVAGPCGSSCKLPSPQTLGSSSSVASEVGWNLRGWVQFPQAHPQVLGQAEWCYGLQVLTSAKAICAPDPSPAPVHSD